MGILEAIRNWLNRLFGKRAEQKNEIVFSEAKNILEKKMQEAEKGVMQKATAKLSEIKHLLRRMETEISEMDKRNLMEEGENKYLRKIVSTSQKNMVMQTKAMLGKLQPKAMANAESLRAYASESQRIIQKEIPSFGKNITYTGVIMKDEIKNIGIMLQELINHYDEAINYFKEAKIDALESIKAKFKEIDDLETASKAKEGSLTKTKAEADALGLEVAEKDEKIKSLNESPECRKILEIKEKLAIAEKEAEESISSFNATISNADKVIKRFLQMAEAKIYLIEKSDEDLLRLYMESPKEASRRDPKAERFKKLLAEMKKAIGEGRLNLKDKELEKRTKAIEELINYDFFTNLFWKLNEIEVKKKALAKELEGIDIAVKINSAEAEKKAALNRLRQAQSAAQSAEKDLATAKENRGKLRADAGALFEKEFGTKINF